MYRKTDIISKREIFGCRFYYCVKCLGFLLRNPFIKKGETVFIGDSITDACRLKKYYPSFVAVNRGISGDTTLGILKRLRLSLYALKPKLVIILIGTNDFPHRATVADIAGRYGKILDELKRNLPACRVLVQSVYPTNDGSFGNLIERNARIKELNPLIEELTESRGYTYADVFDLLTDEKGYMKAELSKDGLHPNSVGYEIISSCLKGFIQEIIDELPIISEK